MPTTPPTVARISLLLGASASGRPIVDFLRPGLSDVADVTPWIEGDFAPTCAAFGAAAFVLCGENDDAVLFRLGMFVGALGRERVVVCPAASAIELPPYLHGLAVARQPASLREHVRRLAAVAGSPVSSPDMQGHVARRLRRSLGTASSAQPGQTLRVADISLTGALLETFGEIPEDRILDLELALETGPRLRVAARVVRIQYPQWGRVGGVGVQFVHFEGSSKADLELYLATTTAS